MTERIQTTLPLRRWPKDGQSDRGTYHLVIFEGGEAEAIAMHARLHRLEFGKGRGFGSVKVMATIGATTWKSSVFPQNKQSEWVLLVSKKVMRAEELVADQQVSVEIRCL